MSFDPEQIEPEVSISAGGDEAVETHADGGLAESIREELSGEAAQAHTIHVGQDG